MHYKRRNGYTLIELLITIGVSAIVVAVVGTMLVGIIRSNQRASVMTQIARNANTAFALLEEELRSAHDIQCTKVDASGCSVIDFIDKDNVHKEFGRAGAGSCDAGNAYLYFRDWVDPGSPKDPEAHEKVTADASEDGVNVSSAVFTITTSNKTAVTASIAIANSACSPLASINQTFTEYVVSKVD